MCNVPIWISSNSGNADLGKHTNTYVLVVVIMDLLPMVCGIQSKANLWSLRKCNQDMAAILKTAKFYLVEVSLKYYDALIM